MFVWLLCDLFRARPRLVDPDLLGQGPGPGSAAEALGVAGIGAGQGGSALLAHELSGAEMHGGRPLEQDRGLWDRLLIRRGLAALGRLGPYALQTASAACHARAVPADRTDWARIAALYQVLAHVSASPVVELNRAVEVGMAEAGGRPADRGGAGRRRRARDLSAAARRAR